MSRALLFVLGVGLAALAAPLPACASAQTTAASAGVDDPFESVNRRSFENQRKLNKSVLRPLARFYGSATPGLIGQAIHNVLTNITEPVVIANDILQARIRRAVRDTLRLTANTTAGFLGLMDVATPAGLPHHDNDFGVTLGRWGVPSGPYLFTPLTGPSTVRDTVGMGVDIALDPLTYLKYSDKIAVAISTQALTGLDTLERSQAQLDALLEGAADPYATLRSVYLQNRQALIRGEESGPVLPPIDEEEPSPPAAADHPASNAPTPVPGPQLAAAPVIQPPPTPAAEADDPTPAIDPDAPIVTARACDLGEPSPPPPKAG